MSDAEVARLSRGLGIDIAVDLNVYTRGARPGIFAEGCAPIQVNYLGYPGTMGAGYMDYVIADRKVLPPESVDDYAEKCVWLPHSYQPNDSLRKIAGAGWTRADAGLPDDAFVFCCFNNNYKILPETFDSWMRILTAVPGSVLWLFADENPVAMANLRAHAEARGVEGARLVFAGHADHDQHLARHRLADLFLDTWPYNAHTTASDALWAGLPVLTLSGRSFASRVGASLLEAVGLLELITRSQDEYERLAIALAKEPERLARLAKILADNRGTSPLFDGKQTAQHLESAYEIMVERYRAGLAPDHIAVSA
jgi:predicted O-linked N-acetylglucosamine transferase (SPINDLY family)